jgi:tetratricopeptide (TPR) repeat protein
MYFDTNQPAQAEAALRLAIQHTTDVSRNRYQIQKAHYVLGRLLAKSGHEAEAQAEMQIVQKLMARTLNQDRNRLSGNASQQNAASGTNSSTISTITAGDKNETVTDSKDLQSLQAFEKQVSPPLADSYNNLGAIAASGKDYATALTCFQRAAEWNSSLEGLDYNWGRAAFTASRFQDAVPPLSRYLAAHPQDANIRSVLAISLFMTKEYAAVVKTLQPILPAIDAVPQVEYVYAASLVKVGQRAAGIERLEAMEKKSPEVPDIHRSLGEAYADGKPSDRSTAAKELTTAIRLNPTDAQAHLDLGKMYLDDDHVKAAIPELETAVRLAPNNSQAHLDLASAYTRGSRPEDAQREQKLYQQLLAQQVDAP